MGNTLSNSYSPQVNDYAFYSSILILKMMDMSLLTAYRRVTTKTGANPEDVKFFTRGKECVPKVNEKVERVRRAHLNDLENIPAFIFISGLYLLTNPEPNQMNLMLKAYTASRVAHTLVYAFGEVPQPVRGITFVIGQGITIYMACKVFRYFW